MACLPLVGVLSNPYRLEDSFFRIFRRLRDLHETEGSHFSVQGINIDSASSLFTNLKPMDIVAGRRQRANLSASQGLTVRFTDSESFLRVVVRHFAKNHLAFKAKCADASIRMV